jgi:hypothetical protein
MKAIESAGPVRQPALGQLVVGRAVADLCGSNLGVAASMPATSEPSVRIDPMDGFQQG